MDEDTLKSLLASSVGDLRRHFDVTAERFERRVELVGEAVTHLDEKVSRRLDETNQALQSGFADTQAMIKF